MNGFKRGEIYNKEKYMHAKMLDHSWWSNKLPRNITPSDVDMFLELDNFFFYFELSSSTSKLNELKKGQEIMYRRLWQSSKFNVVLVCKHAIDSAEKLICTPTDFDNVGIYYMKKFSKHLSKEEFIGFCEYLGKNGPVDTLERLREFQPGEQ